jgi:RNA polymerase sigma-70 factor, ECF subfamily
MLQAASRDDKGIFEELFRELYRPVLGIFAKLGCSREDCEDLTEETFLRAFRSFSEFRGEAKPLTWLHTIADNVWRNRLRDRGAAKRDGVEVPIPDNGQTGAAFQERAHDQGIGAERRRLLKSAVEKLPPKMRRCVWLRVYQDMSFAEIAEVLGVSAGTAKSHFSLARSRLRPLLAEHYPELEDDLEDDR